jgi:hypothetical protein
MVLVSYHTTLRILKGRHKGNKEKDGRCSDNECSSNHIICEKFNDAVFHNQIPNAPKKNRLPVVA